MEDSCYSPVNSVCASEASLPECLEIKCSRIPNAGKGVYSKSLIPKGVRFGPYVGKKVKMEDIDEETNTSYMWEVN